MRCSLLLILCLLMHTPLLQNRTTTSQPETVYLLKPARVFDGESAQLHEGWVVMVRGQKIEAAVDAAGEALRDPERTPSAAFLSALRTEQASFFEYTLGLAESHAAYFRDFALAPAREQALSETARRSLEEAQALPGKDTLSFADYLKDYFSLA